MNALISRRTLLLAGAGIALGGGAVATVRLPAPGPGLRVLGEGEARIVEAIARVLFPPGIFPVAGGDGGTAPGVDALLAGIFPAHTVAPFRYVLRAMELGTLVARGRSFTELPLDEAREVVAIWSGDDPLPRRLASDSLKLVVGTAFLRRPEVLARIGFRAGCMHEEPAAPPLPGRSHAEPPPGDPSVPSP